MSSFLRAAVLALPATTGIALAQAPSAPAAGASAVASTSSAQAPGYRSAFDGYRGFTDQPVVPWRKSNETVARIGGWQAYARESQGAPSAAEPAASPASTALPARRADGGKP